MLRRVGEHFSRGRNRGERNDIFLNQKQAEGPAEGVEPGARLGGRHIGKGGAVRRPFHVGAHVAVQSGEGFVGGGGRPPRGEGLAFAKRFYLPHAQQRLVVAGVHAKGTRHNEVEPVAAGVDELAEIFRRPLGAENHQVRGRTVGRIHHGHSGDGMVGGRKIERFGEPQGQRAGKAAEFVLGFLHRSDQVRIIGQRELGKGNAAQMTFLGGKELGGHRLQAVKPDWFADTHEGDLRSIGTDGRAPDHTGRRGRVRRGDHFRDRIGEPVEALLQLGPLQTKQNIEHMLRGIRIAHSEVGLKKVEARGRTVALGVVTRRDEFDDFVDVPVRTEIAGDGHEDIGPVSSRAREHVFVERDGGREFFGGQFLTGGLEQGFDAADGRSGRRRRRGRGRRDRRMRGIGAVGRSRRGR